MNATLKTLFICEVCTAQLIVDYAESTWTFKHHCERCQAERIFLRDMVIPDPSPYQAPPNEPNSIYLFRAGNRYKIGISKDPQRRLYDLSASPLPIEFVWSLQVGNASMLEGQLHKIFQEKRAHGEWFELSREDVAWIKKWAGDYGQEAL